jgi:hypothetical protein
VATFSIPGKVQENGQVGVPAPDQNKMLSHGSPAPGTSFLHRHSSEEEKIKTCFFGVNDADLVKSPDLRFSVIPAKAGIQPFQIVMNYLDSGFSTLRSGTTAEDGHRSDAFLREHRG